MSNYFKPQRDVERDPARLLFLGSLDWRPNLDAITLLLDDIFPKVRAAQPAATLSIVGRRPPDWLKTRVRTSPASRTFADVPDVRPFLATAGMLVVPLRIGGGSRLKILEALAAGTPVISTGVGAEGLQLSPGRDLETSATPAELAAKILEAIRRPDDAQELAENGRRSVLARYSWGPLAVRLGEVWQDAARRIGANRRVSSLTN